MFLLVDFNVLIITELSNTLAFLFYAILLLAKLKIFIINGFMGNKLGADEIISIIVAIVLLCFWPLSKCSNFKDSLIDQVRLDSLIKETSLDSTQLRKIFENSNPIPGSIEKKSPLDKYLESTTQTNQARGQYIQGVTVDVSLDLSSTITRDGGWRSPVKSMSGFKQVGATGILNSGATGILNNGATGILNSGSKYINTGQVTGPLSVSTTKNRYPTNESERLGFKK